MAHIASPTLRSRGKEKTDRINAEINIDSKIQTIDRFNRHSFNGWSSVV